MAHIDLDGLDNTGKTFVFDTGLVTKLREPGVKGGTIKPVEGSALTSPGGCWMGDGGGSHHLSGSTLSVRNGMVLNGTLTVRSIDYAGAACILTGRRRFGQR